MNTTVHVRFSRVFKPGAIRKETDIDVRGYDYSVSNQAISHTLKNHGNAAVEAKRGHLAVERSDFARLPQIVRTGRISPPDAHKSSHKRFVVKGDIGYFAVFEIKTGKKRIDLWTMRKKKGSW